MVDRRHFLLPLPTFDQLSTHEVEYYRESRRLASCYSTKQSASWWSGEACPCWDRRLHHLPRSRFDDGVQVTHDHYFVFCSHSSFSCSLYCLPVWFMSDKEEWCCNMEVCAWKRAPIIMMFFQSSWWWPGMIMDDSQRLYRVLYHHSNFLCSSTGDSEELIGAQTIRREWVDWKACYSFRQEINHDSIRWVISIVDDCILKTWRYRIIHLLYVREGHICT